MKTARMEVDRTDRERAAKRDQENTPKSGGRSSGGGAGVQSVYRPELSSIGDVLRKAQTAGLGETKEMAMAREQLNLQKQTVQAARENTEATRSLQIGLR